MSVLARVPLIVYYFDDVVCSPLVILN